jgi:hypothetical protein
MRVFASRNHFWINKSILTFGKRTLVKSRTLRSLGRWQQYKRQTKTSKVQTKTDKSNVTLIEGQEDWKIWPPYEVFYIECIKTASLNAIGSWEAINEIVSNESSLKTNAIDTVDLAENIVNQAGIISKYFFPPVDEKKTKNQIHKFRGKKLREAFKIDDNHQISDRKFRNYVEHFDEKLDLFLNKSVAGNIIPSKTIYSTSTDIDEVTFVFKAYIINEFKFISLNEQIILPKLVEEIYAVYNLCIEFLDNGGRLK